MAELGARAYRFSISWSRVLPTGTGAVNQRGLDFYERLVDALLGAGVQPLINLFHWDLPQALQDRGGFANPEVVGWFTDYAALLASSLGDRVKDWMTFNEPAVFAFLGHADGIHAPGLQRLADGDPGRRQRAARPRRAPPRRSARSVDGAKVGVAIDVNQVAPATDSERDRRRRRPVELRSRRVVPRSALRPWLPGAGARGAPRGGSPRRRRPRRAAGRRPRLPGPELLPARLGQRQVGPRLRLGDRRRAGLGADADGLARRARRPARRPDRAQPDVRTARDRGHRERRRVPRHRRSGRPGARRGPAGATWPATSPRRPTRFARACR